MKKGIIIYLLLNFIFIHFAQGQDLFSTNLTPDGKLDNVFDRYGKKIPLKKVEEPKQLDHFALVDTLIYISRLGVEWKEIQA